MVRERSRARERSVEQESAKHDCCVVVRTFLNLISVIFGGKCETERTSL